MSQYSGIAGKRVLVTGATSGLGLAMAEALLKAGAKVAISGRDQAKIDRVVSTSKSLGGETTGIVIDVRDEESIKKGVAKVAGLWGGIDILINNAGIGMATVNPNFLTDPKPFWDISGAAFRDLIDTNFTGYFLVAKEVVPHFLVAGRGQIINIGVTDFTMQAKGFIPYGPSRAGSDSLSHIMAKDLAEFGVTVNILMPGGGTVTGLFPENVRKNLSSIEAARGIKFLTPDVMAEATLFLCSDEGRNVHDQRISAKDFEQWHADWLSQNPS